MTPIESRADWAIHRSAARTVRSLGGHFSCSQLIGFMATAKPEDDAHEDLRAELREVFFYTRDELGIDAAIEAVIAASRRVRIFDVPTIPIIDEACRIHGIDRSQFFGPSRVAELCDCRAVAAWIMRACGMALSTIARKIGRGDHTTVLAAIGRCERNPEILRQAKEIRRKTHGLAGI